MKSLRYFAPIKTKDIADIMGFLHVSHTLSPIAYKRLHYYVVSLERMLEEALRTVRETDEERVMAGEKIYRN